MNTKKVTIIGSYAAAIFLKSNRLPLVGETVLADEFIESRGGKGSNQALAVSRFGCETTFIACIGNDKYGRDALSMYKQFGINTEMIKIDDTVPTGIGVILIDKDGRNLISNFLGANLNLYEEDIDAAEDCIKNSCIVGFQLESRLETVEYAIRKVHSMRIKTLLDPAPAKKLSQDLYPDIDYIKPNEIEATLLTGIEVTDRVSAEMAGRWFVEKGVGTAIITLGEKGAVLVTDSKSQYFPTPNVKAIDTTGAGDIFSAGLIAAIAQGKTIEDSIIFANHAAALSTTRLGVVESIPKLEEVIEFLNNSPLKEK